MIKRKIAVNFDGTIVENKFPLIGPLVPGALVVIFELQQAGHILLLETSRKNQKLKEAIDFCIKCSLKFEENDGSFDLLISDKAIGCPLIFPKGKGRFPFADWFKIRRILTHQPHINI